MASSKPPVALPGQERIETERSIADAFDSDPARTPRYEDLVAASRRDTRDSPSHTGRDGQQTNYFALSSALQQTGSLHLASQTSVSNESSPFHSSHASTASFQSSQAGEEVLYNTHAADVDAQRRTTQKLKIESQAGLHFVSELAGQQASALHLTSQQPLQRESLHYPDQSLAALHSQYYTPPYRSPPLQKKSSHTSQLSIASRGSLYTSQDQTTVTTVMASGTLNTPCLFNPSRPPSSPNNDNDKRGQNSTPLLHPTHLQAPKE
jgi:hypothetical protein